MVLIVNSLTKNDYVEHSTHDANVANKIRLKKCHLSIILFLKSHVRKKKETKDLKLQKMNETKRWKTQNS